MPQVPDVLEGNGYTFLGPSRPPLDQTQFGTQFVLPGISPDRGIGQHFWPLEERYNDESKWPHIHGARNEGQWPEVAQRVPALCRK